MTTLEITTIKKAFGVNANSGIEYSSDDNCFDYWEGKDCNGDEIIVSLSTYEWAYTKDKIFRHINI